MDSDELRSAAPEVERQRHPETAGGAQPARLPEPAAALARLAGSAGNRNVARTIARLREGEGILPGGLVHPDVEAAIAAANGRGTALDHTLANRVGGAFGDHLGDVRLHHDDHAAALSRAVAARAFTVGRDIFFGAGQYQPSSANGQDLITHELAHVVQQRSASPSGPLTVSQPGDALELEAEAAARGVG